MYVGIDKFFHCIADTIREEGPFDGVIGFSQGDCAGPIVASLLEPELKATMDAARRKDPEQIAYPDVFLQEDGGPIQPPLKFVIACSGFPAPFEHYRGFYEPNVRLGYSDVTMNTGIPMMGRRAENVGVDLNRNGAY